MSIRYRRGCLVALLLLGACATGEPPRDPAADADFVKWAEAEMELWRHTNYGPADRAPVRIQRVSRAELCDMAQERGHDGCPWYALVDLRRTADGGKRGTATFADHVDYRGPREQAVILAEVAKLYAWRGQPLGCLQREVHAIHAAALRRRGLDEAAIGVERNAERYTCEQTLARVVPLS